LNFPALNEISLIIFYHRENNLCIFIIDNSFIAIMYHNIYIILSSKANM